MKGFKPTGKRILSGHGFPKEFGFSGSTGEVRSVGPHTRRVAKAKGGEVHPDEAQDLRLIRSEMRKAGIEALPDKGNQLAAKVAAARGRARKAMGSLPEKLGEMKSSMDQVAGKVLKKARGGAVGNAATLRNQPSNQLDVEYGGKTPLRPGFKRGGAPKCASGVPRASGKGSVGSFRANPLVGR